LVLENFLSALFSTVESLLARYLVDKSSHRDTLRDKSCSFFTHGGQKLESRIVDSVTSPISTSIRSPEQAAERQTVSVSPS
jgi:hypothetical protein